MKLSSVAKEAASKLPYTIVYVSSSDQSGPHAAYTSPRVAKLQRICKPLSSKVVAYIPILC